MERERVTISIKKDLLKRIDSTIDGVVVRNRSHAIENLVSGSLGTQKNKNVVILLGGKNAPKLLPQVKEALLKLKSSGYEKVYIALGSLAEKAKESLGNGRDFGLIIEYIKEGEGTGGALLPLKQIFDDTFLVFNPGEIFPGNIDDLIQYHKDHSLVATIATDNLEELKGTYILDPKIFQILPDDFSMLEDDIFPELIAKNDLAIYPII